MTEAPRGVVLLCAGRGTRMRPLTEHVPKCLLQVGRKPILDYLLDAILARTEAEVVAVTGFAADRVSEHLATTYGERVHTTHNRRFDEDVNILSVETGVAALRYPEHGYLVVETDLLIADAAWDRIFAAMAGPNSFWPCKDYYNPQLTGGIVHGDERGWIDRVEYRPRYDESFHGWSKMLGMLGVGPAQVSADRRHRQEAIADTIAQYYLAPWREHLSDLPCRVLQLDECFAQSFNTTEDFANANERYLELLAAQSLKHP